MKIGEISAATGLSVETIRYYEREGLIAPPARTQSNYRSYGGDTWERLIFIRRARDLGFSLDQVRQLLDLADDRGRPCDAVDEIARQHLTQVKTKMKELAALGKELESVIGQCRRGRIDDCRIIESLAKGRTDANRSGTT